jgi:hypothetical protein
MTTPERPMPQAIKLSPEAMAKLVPKREKTLADKMKNFFGSTAGMIVGGVALAGAGFVGAEFAGVTETRKDSTEGPNKDGIIDELELGANPIGYLAGDNLIKELLGFDGGVPDEYLQKFKDAEWGEKWDMFWDKASLEKAVIEAAPAHVTTEQHAAFDAWVNSNEAKEMAQLTGTDLSKLDPRDDPDGDGNTTAEELTGKGDGNPLVDVNKVKADIQAFRDYIELENPAFTQDAIDQKVQEAMNNWQDHYQDMYGPNGDGNPFIDFSKDKDEYEATLQEQLDQLVDAGIMTSQRAESIFQDYSKNPWKVIDSSGESLFQEFKNGKNLIYDEKMIEDKFNTQIDRTRAFLEATGKNEDDIGKIIGKFESGGFNSDSDNDGKSDWINALSVDKGLLGIDYDTDYKTDYESKVNGQFDQIVGFYDSLGLSNEQMTQVRSYYDNLAKQMVDNPFQGEGEDMNLAKGINGEPLLVSTAGLEAKMEEHLTGLREYLINTGQNRQEVDDKIKDLRGKDIADQWLDVFKGSLGIEVGSVENNQIDYDQWVGRIQGAKESAILMGMNEDEANRLYIDLVTNPFGKTFGENNLTRLENGLHPFYPDDKQPERFQKEGMERQIPNKP